MAASTISMWIYPWDIQADGVENTVQRCKEEFGLTSISLTCSYHSGKFLLPHRDNIMVYLPEPGSVFFKPQASFYNETSLRPRVSPLAAENILERTADACDRYGLALRAWIVATHGSYHGIEHPECLQVNAFGDAYPYTVCPSNPQVRSYVVALVKDLASRGHFAAIDLESPGFALFSHGHHHELTGLSRGPLEELLLSLCFCESCIRRGHKADIDVDELRSEVKSLLLKRLNSDVYWPRAERDDTDELFSLVISNPELYQFLRLRNDIVTTLVSDVRLGAIEGGSVKLAVTAATFVKPAANAWIEGEDLPALAGEVDEIIALAYFPEVERVVADADFCLAAAREPSQVVLGQSLLIQGAPSLENVLAKIKFTKECGISKYSFYNYGFIGEGRRAWLGKISEAIRS